MKQEQILEFRLLVQRFIRQFGLLDQTKTPCGFDLSPSQVMAMQELETETMTVRELAEKLQLDRSTVSRLADALVKGGFVHREINEQNRREVLLSLTEKGKNSIRQVRDQSVRFFQAMLRHVKEEEQGELLRAFRLLTGALTRVREEEAAGR